MRVTHIIKSASLMGVERHLVLLLNALQGHGVDVELVVLAAPGDDVPPVVDLATHKRIPTHIERVPVYPTPAVVRRLAAHLRERQPDLAHLHGWEAEVYGYFAARQAGIRRVVCSGYGGPVPGLSGLAGWLRPRLLSRLDRVIAVNQQVFDQAVAQGMRPDKLALIPFGIAPDSYGVGKGARDVVCAELGIGPEAALIGMVCALDQVAGLDRALESMWHLSAQRKNVHLLIVGEGPQRAALERMARGYHIADRVHFLGWREDAHAIIAALDILLLTCLSEDPTMLLLEAAALQTPVIAAAFESVSGLITEGETGLLVSINEGMDHMTSGLWLLLDDPEMRRRLGLRAHDELASRFTFQPVVDGTLGVYKSVLA